MLYDVRTLTNPEHALPGSVAPPYRFCRVFDANGVELHRVVACDTETGKVWTLHPDPRRGNEDPDEAMHPGPLRVESKASGMAGVSG